MNICQCLVFSVTFFCVENLQVPVGVLGVVSGLGWPFDDNNQFI